MDSLGRFQKIAMRITLLLVVLGVAALYPFSVVAAKGLALGGLAGLAGLWILYRQTQGMVGANPADVHVRFMQGTFLRLPLYGVALYWAYQLDTESSYGMLAAVAGLFVVHGVIMFLALTGLDVNKDEL